VHSGLEDQLLGIVVAEERPDLEEAKNQLIVSNAKMKQELKEIEDRILVRLSSSEGSPVDDIDLINTLEASKVKSQEIQVCRTSLLTTFLPILAANELLNCFVTRGPVTCLCTGALSTLATPLDMDPCGLKQIN